MPDKQQVPWQKKIVQPSKVMEKIEPGMSIFIGTGLAEPRTLVKVLMNSEATNLVDLELIQLISLGDAISLEARYPKKYRLKTFFSGWIANEAVTAGRIDLIPCRFSRVPRLIESGAINIDVAFVQITTPDENGYSSLGLAIDVARQAMEKASLVVGEISHDIPRTLGDTFVHVSEFDYLIEGTEPVYRFNRWQVDDVFDKIGRNVASLVEDGNCLLFGIGPLFESLSQHLTSKKDLGIHSPFITDALMELIKSGAVTNRYKNTYRGKCLVSYALGTKDLMYWLDQNPLIEFQGVDIVGDQKNIGLNDRFTAIIPVRKADLTGEVAMHIGRGNVTYGPGETQEFFSGALLSRGGRTICALPSRNLANEANIRLSIADIPNQLSARESLDIIVTEYGVASLKGRTVRERALAIIDVAHPDDRAELVRQAKEAHILYADQIYLSEAGHLYPSEITHSHTFKDGLTLRFRAIRPSDEEQMRRLFYRFSDEAVYYRYFSPVKTMPHARMQEYVNVDYRDTISVIGLVGPEGEGKIVAEARYVRAQDRPYADVAFIVDEEYGGKGIATYMYELLIEIAKQRGIKGFTADVLGSNKAMLRVFWKAPYPIKSVLVEGAHQLTIPFTDNEKMPDHE